MSEPQLIVGCIVYNEEHRFLKTFLENAVKYADKLVMIDDGSDDNSLQMCMNTTPYVYRTDRFFIKNESILRSVLWNQCVEAIDSDNAWIYIQDCDEFVHERSVTKLKYEISKADNEDADALAFNFYDMWNSNQYRDDKLWKAHQTPLVHIVKYKPALKYNWNKKPFHCGRLPINAYTNAYISNIQVLHLSYSKESLRKEKFKSYMKIDGKGKCGSLEQYYSILDPMPHLVNFESNFK